MVAGGGASVIYADTICALGGSEELGRGKQKPQMDRIIIVVDSDSNAWFPYFQKRKITIMSLLLILVYGTCQNILYFQFY